MTNRRRYGSGGRSPATKMDQMYCMTPWSSRTRPKRPAGTDLISSSKTMRLAARVRLERAGDRVLLADRMSAKRPPLADRLGPDAKRLGRGRRDLDRGPNRLELLRHCARPRVAVPCAVR